MSDVAMHEGVTASAFAGGITVEELRGIVSSIISSEIAPLTKSVYLVLGELLDPWEKIHSETESAVKAAEKMNMEPVTQYYCVGKKTCMVLGRVTHCHVVCAHIWPRGTIGKGLEIFDLHNADVNNPRNFLRLQKSIEKAFDDKRLIFVPVSLALSGALTLKVVILDPSLNTEDLSYNNITVKFSTIQKKLFSYTFLPGKTPFTRLLANHAVQAMNKAKILGWISEVDSDAVANRSSVIEMARRYLGGESTAMKTFLSS